MLKKELIKLLRKTINDLEEENIELKKTLDYEVGKNKILYDDLVIILENGSILRDKIKELLDKIKDLENNIEFLVANLTPKKKEIIGRK